MRKTGMKRLAAGIAGGGAGAFGNISGDGGDDEKDYKHHAGISRPIYARARISGTRRWRSSPPGTSFPWTAMW